MNSMNDREQFQIIRGNDIKLHPVLPKDVICFETSDSTKICKNPVVSVCMITYNHGTTIAKAIEGVLSQRTDFPFELVIGEDCSRDNTREICFKYQKAYPNLVRVLWANENVFLKGSNDRRTIVHCRGEYIAFCEGDDYWTDSYKLQKQVDVMRAFPSVGLCFCGARIESELSGGSRDWNAEGHLIPGFMQGVNFFIYHSFGRNPSGIKNRDERFIMTATTLVKASVLRTCMERYEIFRWRLSLLDSIMWLAIAANSDVYYLADKVAVYRQTRSGACGTAASQLWIDGQIVRAWFCRNAFGLSLSNTTTLFRGELLLHLLTMASDRYRSRLKDYINDVMTTDIGRDLFGGFLLWPVRCLYAARPDSRIVRGILYQYVLKVYSKTRQPKTIKMLYKGTKTL